MDGRRIPLVDLERQNQAHADEFKHALTSCIDANRFVGGEPVREFERKFAEFCGGGYTAACGSGTDALYLAILEILGEGDGTEKIITVSHTFVATVEAIVRAGYEPVLVDVEPGTYLMDLQAVEDAITQACVAVIPVHLYGQMVDMGRLMEIARRHSLRVIEDAAQAHGAARGGVRPGELSDAACFSFYPGKNLGAWGDGGAVFTRNEKLASRIRMRCDHGRDPGTKYEHAFLGMNSRLDSMQAAILSVKLKHLNEWNAARRRLAGRYAERLSGHPHVAVPTVADDADHVFHLYIVSIPDRDAVLEDLQASGIGAGVHYPIPVHQQPALAGYEACFTNLEETEKAARSVLSLPIFPELELAEVDAIAGKLANALAKCRGA